jgi:hypothetical protein
MRLVVSFCFEIDTRSTQTPKNRHKMQKIDTNGVPLYARIVRATVNDNRRIRVYDQERVNDKRRIRVYADQERVGEFDTIQEALKFITHDRSKREGHADGRVLHEEQKL